MSVPSSELAPPAPFLYSECVPPPQPKGVVGQHSLAGEGPGGTNSDDWRKSLALCLLCGVPLGTKGGGGGRGQHLLAGEGAGGSQSGRLEGKHGTLYTL